MWVSQWVGQIDGSGKAMRRFCATALVNGVTLGESPHMTKGQMAMIELCQTY